MGIKERPRTRAENEDIPMPSYVFGKSASAVLCRTQERISPNEGTGTEVYFDGLGTGPGFRFVDIRCSIARAWRYVRYATNEALAITLCKWETFN